jgi:hypothetical protein
MAESYSRDSDEGDERKDLSLVESIKKIAADNARSSLETEESILLFLKSWWSRTYNRPLKDPILLSYTLEELMYEFFDRSERAKAEQERLNNEKDKIEEQREKETMDWAEQEEKKELEALNKTGATASAPSKEDIEWMEKYMQESRQQHGDDFGEDVSINFEE